MGVGADLQAAAALIDAAAGALGRPLTLLAETTSTSDDAREAARRGAPHGATWIAERQTAGRGRRGHEWVCPAGEGLLFSVLLRVDTAPARLPLLALLAGLAVRDAVAAAAPLAQVAVKWPNDVLGMGRKVAGVLVEATTSGARVQAVVVGIGVNVHTRTFPAELAERATSVALLTRGDSPDRARILTEILASLDRDLPTVLTPGLGEVPRRLAAADALSGRRVRSDAGEEGIASGIDDHGRLLVRRDDGVLVRWIAGEVHLVTPWGGE